MSFTDFRCRGENTLKAAALAAACLLAPQLASAVPITVNAVNVWRADRMPNPIGFLPTALVPWVDVTTSSGDVNQTHVTASTGGNTYDLTRIATGALAGLYFAQIPYDVALDDPWTITATNGTDVVTRTRPAFVPVEAMPFVDSITFTGTGSDITVHWDVADAALPRLTEQNVSIWDLSSFAAPTTVRFFGLDKNARSVDLSALGLDPGVRYAVEINNVSRNLGTGFIDAFSGNWLNDWTPTVGGGVVLVPEPATLSLLLVGLAGAGLMRRRSTRPA